MGCHSCLSPVQVCSYVYNMREHVVTVSLYRGLDQSIDNQLGWCVRVVIPSYTTLPSLGIREVLSDIIANWSLCTHCSAHKKMHTSISSAHKLAEEGYWCRVR